MIINSSRKLAISLPLPFAFVYFVSRSLNVFVLLRFCKEPDYELQMLMKSYCYKICCILKFFNEINSSIRLL